MAKLPDESELRRWATTAVQTRSRDMSRAFSEQFGVSRQSAVAALKRLVDGGWLQRSGRPTRPAYAPGENRLIYFTEPLPNEHEDRIWIERIAPFLSITKNVEELAMYCFTEIFNNANDHSAGTSAFVWVKQARQYLNLQVFDNGIGIFDHIAATLGLAHPRLALLELSKGKLTTDPDRHSGEGIFFSSRMCDFFKIAANELEFTHEASAPLDWLQDANEPSSSEGTRVVMHIPMNTERTPMQVFSEYSTGEDRLGFDKTVVPVRLAKVGTVNLVSRSQAKRLTAGFDKFRIVVLDFAEVDEIGQAFSDELFRVFAAAHPMIELVPVNMSPAVEMMRARVTEGSRPT